MVKIIISSTIMVSKALICFAQLSYLTPSFRWMLVLSVIRWKNISWDWAISQGRRYQLNANCCDWLLFFAKFQMVSLEKYIVPAKLDSPYFDRKVKMSNDKNDENQNIETNIEPSPSLWSAPSRSSSRWVNVF